MSGVEVANRAIEETAICLDRCVQIGDWLLIAADEESVAWLLAVDGRIRHRRLKLRRI